MQKSPGEGWSSAFIPASPCSGQTAPRASHCSAGCANRVAGWVGDSPGGSVTATEGPPMGQNNTQLAQVPRQHRVHVPDAGTATGAVLALLEAGTAPHMMQGQLSVPFGSALPAGLRFEAPDPGVFPRTGQPPPEPDRCLRGVLGWDSAAGCPHPAAAAAFEPLCHPHGSLGCSGREQRLCQHNPGLISSPSAL